MEVRGHKNRELRNGFAMCTFPPLRDPVCLPRGMGPDLNQDENKTIRRGNIIQKRNGWEKRERGNWTRRADPNSLMNLWWGTEELDSERGYDLC